MKSIQSLLLYIIVPITGGMIYASGFPHVRLPSFSLSFLGPIFGIAIFLYSLSIIRCPGVIPALRKNILVLISFSLGANIVAYYWIPYVITVFGNIHPPFNYILGILFSLIIFPQYIVLLILHRLALSIKIRSKFPLILNTQIKRNFFIAIILTLCDYFTPQQFPAHPGHAWLSLAPHLGLAPIFGIPLFSFISYWLASSITCFAHYRKIDYLPIGTFILFLIINFSLPLKLDNVEKEVEEVKVSNIRLVQANIGNLDKINSEKGYLEAREEVHNRYRKLSLLPSKQPLDLIIWPETAYPDEMHSEILKAHPKLIPDIFEEIIHHTQAEILTGGYDLIQGDDQSLFESHYNTIFFFGLKNSEVVLLDRFHKTKLIPFGETLPFGRFNKYLSKYIDNISYFAAGNSYPLFETKNGLYFITAICYEILFPSLINNYLNSVKHQPHFLVNFTNDSWYGDTSEPYQHLFLSKWRALEFNLPVVRITNTGITSILYPDGSESENLGIYDEDILDITLKSPTRTRTLFQRWGFWGVTIIWMFIALGFFCESFLKKIVKSNKS